MTDGCTRAGRRAQEADLPTPRTKPPADFRAMRTCLVQTLAACLGLPEGQIMFEEQEAMDAPRPDYPYVGILTVDAGSMAQDDFYIPVHDAPDAPTALFDYIGERQMVLSLDCYGSSHREAYSIGSTLQAMLQQVPTRDRLRRAGLVVMQVGTLQDVSELLNTGYEGRSQLDLTLSYVSRMTIDMGRMDTIEVTGAAQPAPTETFSAERKA